jgi:hypothetical protein
VTGLYVRAGEAEQRPFTPPGKCRILDEWLEG